MVSRQTIDTSELERLCADSSGYINERRIAVSDGTVCSMVNGCSDSTVYDPKFARHNGGSNVAFWDGHVKWESQITCTQLKCYYWQ